MSPLKIGDRVMGGSGDTFDVGTIHGIAGDMADVGWESGQRTPAHLADLSLYDADEVERQALSRAAIDEMARGTPADWYAHEVRGGLSTPLPPDHDFRGHTADYRTLAEWAAHA